MSDGHYKFKYSSFQLFRVFLLRIQPFDMSFLLLQQYLLFMKSVLCLLVCSLLIGKISAVSTMPNWVINPNIDAGQVVSINSAANDFLNSASRTKQQHFNKTNFSIAPRVILSMIGYGHAPPSSASTPIGLKTSIISINATHFNYTTTVYTVTFYLLNYLYLAIQYQNTAFFMESQFLIFNGSNNVFNEFASVRYDTISFANPGGMINNNYTNQDIQFLAFPTGFNLLPKSGRFYFSVNASILNSTHYNVNISTIGNNILYELSFSILAFNRGVIMANYIVFIDVVLSNQTGNSTAYITTPFTAQQYMFRNCLAGGFHFEYPATANFFYYYTMSSPANDFLLWRAFNNRVRSCPANTSYYEPTSALCYDICPALFYANATSLLCLPCHYSCQQCSGPYSQTLCSSCSSVNNRILNGTQCLCDIGFYDNGVSLCLSCNYQCLTCSNGTNNSCSSCSGLLFRQFDSSLFICNCQSGYYQNTSCLACSTQILACLTCAYDVILNNLTCSTCNISLFRVLSNDSKQCQCQSGYYDNTTCFTCFSQIRSCLTCKYDIALNNLTCLTCNTSSLRYLSNDSKNCLCQTQYYSDPVNFTCIACPIGCLACQSGPVCRSCDSNLNRTMSSGNTSCDCIAAYYQNGSGMCVSCPIGCLICSLGATGPICSSCNILVNRIMGPSNTSCVCQGGYFQDNTNTCTICQNGCLSCYLSNGSLICSSCDSTLNRVIGISNLSCPCSPTYYQAANLTCQPCQLGCLVCALSGASLLCSSCNLPQNRTLNSSNLTCDCLSNFYDNSSTCYQCPNTCTTCTNSTYCTSCAATYIMNINNTCISCSAHCSNCSAIAPVFTEICNACISGYNLVNSSCVLGTFICGDGVISGSQQCDDNNANSGDGCSSSCRVQTNHACINNATVLSYSLCYYSYPIGLAPQLIYKIPGQNSVKLELSVDAPLCNTNLLQNYLELTAYVLLLDRTRLLQTAWIAIPTKQVSYSSSSMVLSILFDYSQDIDLSLKEIQITPSAATSSSYLKYFYASPSAKASLSSPFNNLSTKFYSASSLKAVSAFSMAFLALVLLFWLGLIMAFVAQKGAVGAECMFVLQLTYLTLLDIPQLGQCWSGLQLNGKYTIGYNFSVLKNSEAADLRALQLDSNLPNTLNITLGLLFLLFLSVIGLRIYEWWLQRKRRKQIMEMNETEQNRSTKIQKQEEYKFERVFVVIIDILLTLMFLTTPVFIIGMSFTSSASLVGNLVEATLLIIILLGSWILFYRRSDTYAWRTISFRSIIVNPTKMTLSFALNMFLKHYYFIQFIFICLVALMIAFMKTSGMVVFIILLLGNIGLSVLHIKIQIYIDRLHSLRAVSNSIALAIVMLLHLIQYYAVNSLDTSISLVVITFLLMLAVLVINTTVLFILWRRQNQKQRDQAHLDMEMKQMANQLGAGLANMSMLQGQDISYNSIKHNNSRDFTKPKVIDQDYESARSQLLNKSKNKKLYGLIEQKIKELKEFKKNIQAQVEGSNFISEDTSEGNNNLEGILDQLQKSNIIGDISAI